MVKKLLNQNKNFCIFSFPLVILFNGDGMEDEKRCEVVGRESAMKNIHIDSNSKEGKLLVEVVDKESSLKKIEE